MTASVFPTELDTFVNPGGGDYILEADHADIHAKANNAIAAVQAQIGKTGSAVSGSVEYRLSTDGHAATHAELGLPATIKQTADVYARPPRLWPVDALPHRLTCYYGGYAWGHSGADNRTVIKVDQTTHVVTTGYQFPTGTAIVTVYAGNGCALLLTLVAATDRYSLYRTTDGTTVSLVHDFGRTEDGATHYQYIYTLNKGISTGKIGGQDAIILSTYNIGDLSGVAAGSAGDVNYLAASYDDGLTWARLNTWNVGAHNIRHFHFVRYDEFRNCWWFGVGDSDAEAMIFRWDGVSAWPGNVSPTTLAATTGFTVGAGTPRWRAVDLIITEDWIYSFTDTVSSTLGGIWRMRPNFTDSHRVNNDVLGKQHDGWSSILCQDGMHLWSDCCRIDAASNAQRHISIYGSANGKRYFEIGRVALNASGVIYNDGFFESANGQIWMSSRGVAGKGGYETTVMTLSGKFLEERPDNLAPAYFVNFSTGNDSNDGKTAATPWLTARKSLASNVITHGARVVLSAGSSAENGISTIDYAANSVPATDTTRHVQISGQGRDSTAIVLTGATSGWKDSSAAKTWNIELCSLTIKQSDTTKLILTDTAAAATPATWTLRDARVGDMVVGSAEALLIQNATVNAYRSSIEQIVSSSKYTYFILTLGTLNAEACLIKGGRGLQQTGGTVRIKQCTFVEYGGYAHLINAASTVKPLIANCVFDRSGQIPIVNNQTATLTLLDADVYGNYYSSACGAEVPAASAIVPANSPVMMSDAYVPFSESPLAGLCASAGVPWDYLGKPFNLKPFPGAIEAQ